jgi:plastocyanin
MYRALCAAALVIAALITSEVSAQEGDREVDKTIELTRRDGKLEFIERGKDNVAPITIVVGQRIRWENRDSEPHTLVSTLTIAGKPLFSTGVIKPGGHEDLLFDIDLYGRAGGKPANLVTVKYRSNEQPGEPGEIRLLSAARR